MNFIQKSRGDHFGVNDIIYNIKGDIMIIKVELDDELENCPSCQILQYYSNKDTFVCPVQCIFCSKII